MPPADLLRRITWNMPRRKVEVGARTAWSLSNIMQITCQKWDYGSETMKKAGIPHAVRRRKRKRPEQKLRTMTSWDIFLPTMLTLPKRLPEIWAGMALEQESGAVEYRGAPVRRKVSDSCGTCTLHRRDAGSMLSAQTPRIREGYPFPGRGCVSRTGLPQGKGLLLMGQNAETVNMPEASEQRHEQAGRRDAVCSAVPVHRAPCHSCSRKKTGEPEQWC